MTARGRIIDAGVLPDGQAYRVWQDWRTGKKIVYVGDATRDPSAKKHKRHGAPGPHGGVRRSMDWLRDRLKECP